MVNNREQKHYQQSKIFFTNKTLQLPQKITKIAYGNFNKHEFYNRKLALSNEYVDLRPFLKERNEKSLWPYQIDV